MVADDNSSYIDVELSKCKLIILQNQQFKEYYFSSGYGTLTTT